MIWMETNQMLSLRVEWSYKYILVLLMSRNNRGRPRHAANCLPKFGVRMRMVRGRDFIVHGSVITLTRGLTINDIIIWLWILVLLSIWISAIFLFRHWSWNGCPYSVRKNTYSTLKKNWKNRVGQNEIFQHLVGYIQCPC